jgi:tetratricopeptide (TPR) repeat protein
VKKLIAILGVFILVSGCITVNVNVPGFQQDTNEVNSSTQNDEVVELNDSKPVSQNENVNTKEDALDYYKKGGDCMDNNDYQNAKYYFKKAVEVNPNYYNATLGLALAELQLGNYGSAKEHALKAIELNYTRCYGYVILAAAQSRLGEYKEAYSTLSMAYKYANNPEEKNKIYDMQTMLATKIQ